MLLLARYARSAAIKGRTNSRNHHFLPECFAAFYQNALRLLPECIAPRTTRGCDTVVMASCFCVDCSVDRLVVMVCFDLHVKRCDRDRGWLSQTLLLSSMQNLKVWKLWTINCDVLIEKCFSHDHQRCVIHVCINLSILFSCRQFGNLNLLPLVQGEIRA